MAVIRLDQTGYATNTVKNRTMEALQSWGEESIVLHTYKMPHDQETLTKCPDCYDAEYSSASEYPCTTCYGVGSYPPFKSIYRVWAMYADADIEHSKDKRGEWASGGRKVWLEPWVSIVPGDFLIRVRQWDNNNCPVSLGMRYSVGNVDEDNLRTGNAYSARNSDRIGMSTTVSELPKYIHPIYAFPIKPDVPVKRFDGQWLGAEI